MKPHRLASIVISALVVALLTACGREPAAVPDGPWPVTMSDPGVLGYLAVPSASSSELSQVCEALLGYDLRGLGGPTPVVIIPLDTKALGGTVAVIAPVENAELLQASLDLWPGLESLGNDRYRLRLEPDAGLTRMVRGLGLATAGMTPGGMLSALGSLGAPTFNLHLVIEDALVFAAPTFEALGACRRVLRSVPGLSEPAGEEVVGSLDAARFRAAYAGEIAQLKAKLRSAAATAAMMAANEGTELPIDADLVDTVFELSGFDNLEWLHLRMDVEGLRGWFLNSEDGVLKLAADLSLAFE